MKVFANDSKKITCGEYMYHNISDVQLLLPAV